VSDPASGAPRSAAPDGPARCSARGCRADAVWVLGWNNPRLHPPERRKTWLACEQHRESLGAFLSARGFLREVEPLDPTPPSAADRRHGPHRLEETRLVDAVAGQLAENRRLPAGGDALVVDPAAQGRAQV
jgi:hypothetical protein